MVYTQMLFALAFDKMVWNSTPGVLSLFGSSLILGSALYVAVQSDKSKAKKEGGTAEEEMGMGTGVRNAEPDGGDDGGRGPLRGVQEVQLRTLRV